jgi:hypothetical protein
MCVGKKFSQSKILDCSLVHVFNTKIVSNRREREWSKEEVDEEIRPKHNREEFPGGIER